MFNLKIPQNIFVHADGFLKAGTPVSDPPHPLDMIPLVTNNAFAAELYLKCLIHVETGQLIKAEHNLQKLFSKLPEKTQTEIEKRFDAEISKGPEMDRSNASEELKEAARSRPASLRAALKEGADAFVEWRYLYEDNLSKNFFALFPLPAILRYVILERKPDWAKFQITMTKIASPLSTSPAPKKRG